VLGRGKVGGNRIVFLKGKRGWGRERGGELGAALGVDSCWERRERGHE